MNSFAQEKYWTANIKFGSTFIYKPFDGYFISSDIAIPLTSRISIKPCFNFGSGMSNDNFSLSYNKDLNPNTTFTFDKLSSNNPGGVLFTSSNLVLDILILGNNLVENPKRHLLSFGLGYGYKSINSTSWSLTDSGTNPYYVGTHYYTHFGIILNLNYAYVFKNNIFTGITAGIDGADEGVFYTGLCIGLRFNPKQVAE